MMDPSIRWPLAVNEIRRNSVANTFGMVRHRIDGAKKPHQGWDFSAAIGTPCFAIADGRVAVVRSGGDFGNLLVHSFELDGKTYYAAYAHLLSFAVEQGENVSRGQLVGKTGKSGNAANLPAADMHLHFEIRTIPLPGLGLAGRISPLEIFRAIPFDHPIMA